MMNAGYYRFQLGDFECICLSDGSLDYPLQNFFSNVPLGEVEAALRQNHMPTDYLTTPYTYLFVDTIDHKVLIDLGAGHLGPRTGKLIHNMHNAGINPVDIDMVVITHAHPDHIGGALDDAGKLHFPNALYYISRTEWEFWFSDYAYDMAPERFVTIARENLGAAREKVQLFDGYRELAPGIRAIPAQGHTPGHSVVEVVSGSQHLMYIGDVVLHPLHLEHPDWLPIYDIIPEEAATSKQSVFDRVAEGNMLVIGQHFHPFPSLGTVMKKETGWKWQAVEMMQANQDQSGR